MANVKIGDPVVRVSAPSVPFEVSVSVGMAGSLRGYMLLQSPLTAALAVANELSRLMDVPVENPTTFGPMQRAALAELANQISGRATMYLADLGLDTDITPPTVLIGDGVTMAVSDQVQFVDAAVHGPGGDLNLVVGLQAS